MITFKEIKEKIIDIENNPYSIRGYRKTQIEFLRWYTYNGVLSKLLRHALLELDVNPLDIIVDMDSFYDSSAYICSDKDNIFTEVCKLRRNHIHTFNFGEYRLQFPVPNAQGKFDSHNLVIYRRPDAQRMLLTYLNDKDVKIELFEHEPFYSK